MSYHEAREVAIKAPKRSPSPAKKSLSEMSYAEAKAVSKKAYMTERSSDRQAMKKDRPGEELSTNPTTGQEDRIMALRKVLIFTPLKCFITRVTLTCYTVSVAGVQRI